MGASTPRALLRSLLFSYLLSGLLLAATSFALYKFRLKESQVTIAVNMVYILSCALAGFVMGKRVQRQRFFCGFAAVNACALNACFACRYAACFADSKSACPISLAVSFLTASPADKSSAGISFKKRDIRLYWTSPRTILFFAQVRVRLFSALVIPT